MFKVSNGMSQHVDFNSALSAMKMNAEILKGEWEVSVWNVVEMHVFISVKYKWENLKKTTTNI